MPAISMPLVSHLSDYLAKLKSYLEDNFDGISDTERQQKVTEVRNLGASFGAMIAPMPLPFADIYGITSVQFVMVRAIGNIYGYKLDIILPAPGNPAMRLTRCPDFQMRVV